MKISGFENLMTEDFSFSTGINQHSKCQFSAMIPEKDTSRYIGMAQERKQVTVTGEDGSILMTGIVYEVNVSFSEMHNDIQVTILSSSIYAEERFPEKRRIFQDTTKTPKKILEYLNQQQPQTSAQFQIKGNAGKIEQKLPEIWLQDCSVNDFAFAQHVSAMHECAIMPEPINDVMRIGQLGDKRESITLCDEYGKTAFHLQGAFDKSKSTITFSTLKKMAVGSVVQFSGDAPYASALIGTPFFITQMCAREEHDYFVYTYTAVKKVEYLEYSLDIPHFLTETGIVTSHKDNEKKGRIQVNFDECEDIGEEENRFWISYLSPYVGEHQNGFIMLPDLRDRVQVLIGAGKCQALGSERVAEIQEDFTDPTKKYMVMETDKISEWSAEQIAFSNAEKSAVILKADSVTVKQDERSAVFNEETVVIQNSTKTSVTLWNQKMELAQNERKITIDENITAKNNDSTLRMEKSKITIRENSSTVTIDKAITMKTGSSSAELQTSKITLKQGGSTVTIDSAIVLKTGSSSAELQASSMKLKSGMSSASLDAGKMDFNSTQINFKSTI